MNKYAPSSVDFYSIPTSQEEGGGVGETMNRMLDEVCNALQGHPSSPSLRAVSTETDSSFQTAPTSNIPILPVASSTVLSEEISLSPLINTPAITSRGVRVQEEYPSSSGSNGHALDLISDEGEREESQEDHERDEMCPELVPITSSLSHSILDQPRSATDATGDCDDRNKVDSTEHDGGEEAGRSVPLADSGVVKALIAEGCADSYHTLMRGKRG
jgi:hypothetical protein